MLSHMTFKFHTFKLISAFGLLKKMANLTSGLFFLPHTELLEWLSFLPQSLEHDCILQFLEDCSYQRQYFHCGFLFW